VKIIRAISSVHQASALSITQHTQIILLPRFATIYTSDPDRKHRRSASARHPTLPNRTLFHPSICAGHLIWELVVHAFSTTYE